MTQSENPLVATAKVQFGANKNNLQEDYNKNFDIEKVAWVAESLPDYLSGFAQENSVELEITLDQNVIQLGRRDGSKLELACFGPNIHDLTRWPSTDEGIETMNFGFEIACGLDDDEMIALVRMFILEGTWGSKLQSLV